MKLSRFKTNSAAIEAGRWVELPDFSGVSVKVRGFGNADYKRLQAKLIEAIPRAERLKGLSPEAEEAIATQLLLDTILIDWRGIDDDDGTPLLFDRATAEKLLSDPDYKPLRLAVNWAAQVVGDDDLAGFEEDAKN